MNTFPHIPLKAAAFPLKAADFSLHAGLPTLCGFRRLAAKNP